MGLRVLRTCVLMCLRVSRAHVPMQVISMHFTAYVYILYAPLCVLIRQDYLFTLRFLKHSCKASVVFLVPIFVSWFLPMFYSAFISFML